jgi:hypothetical protein
MPDRERLLLSGRASARLLGVDQKVWPRIAAANKIESIPTGKRSLYRRVDVERLGGLRGNT